MYDKNLIYISLNQESEGVMAVIFGTFGNDNILGTVNNDKIFYLLRD